MIAIVIGILMFLTLVVLHELGHFWAAKKSGVKVLEFGIGIPPKLFTMRKDSDGTEYSLNTIPLGGFVRIKGENPHDHEELHAKDSFVQASLWKKILILLGGVIVNALVAWCLFVFCFWKGFQPLQILPDNMLAVPSQSYLMPSYSFLSSQGFISGNRQALPVVVEEILTGFVAAKADIQSGDRIIAINGQTVDTVTFTKRLKDLIGKSFTLDLVRQGKSLQKTLTCPEENCLLGILVGTSGSVELQTIQFTGWNIAAKATHELLAQSSLTFHALGQLGKNLFSFDQQKTSQALDGMSGPVGAVKFGDLILQSGGWIQYLGFVGMISLALALFNILPLPALDGGRLLGVLIQHIFRFKAEKYLVVESYINMVMFVLLMGLGVYIIFKDLVKFRGVSIPFIG